MGEKVRILFCKIFVNYTQKSAVRALTSMGHTVVEKQYYTPEDNYNDTRLLSMIEEDVKAGYDLVMSINFWPLVARAAHNASIPYAAWCYDCPMNLPTEQDMEYDTNFIFMFDRLECRKYADMGITRIFHMPLATDCEMWEKVKVPAGSEEYDVSFLGSLYESTFPQI
ncbi:MAG: DUF3880 domain-containing protein, partial [Eubacterium sp.]|nr:DUF3880 domain-containing protein [Eubacterium sp.]